jgi:hypothetical protein
MAALLVDLFNQALCLNNIPPAVYTGTTQGAGQDASNAEVTTNLIVNVGAYGNGMTTAVVQAENATTTSGPWTQIPGMIVTATTSNQILGVTGIRSYRYVRCNCITATGTTVSVALQAGIFSQYKYSNPLQDTGGVSRSPSS